jgi:hypothetical protein
MSSHDTGDSRAHDRVAVPVPAAGAPGQPVPAAGDLAPHAVAASPKDEGRGGFMSRCAAGSGRSPPRRPSHRPAL